MKVRLRCAPVTPPRGEDDALQASCTRDNLHLESPDEIGCTAALLGSRVRGNDEGFRNGLKVGKGV